MTIDEAIIYFKQCNSKIISVCKDENRYDYKKQEIISDCARKTYEANRLALEALEQESCDDAISRKKVIDTIYCECSCENLDIDFAKVLLLQRAIKALPPVTSQPKMGVEG